MSRVWSSLAVASVVGLLAGCGGDAQDVGALEDVTGAQTSELRGCEAYNTFTAALGEATVACLGTISLDAYSVDKAGRLRRRDDLKCNPNVAKDPNNPDRDALRDIDDLLALQSPEVEKDLPEVSYCMAQNWAAWSLKFRSIGNTTCPQFAKVESFGVAAVAPKDTEHYVDIEKYIKTLPRLGEKPMPVEIAPSIGKSYAFYKVSFPDGRNPNKGCRDPLTCANQCAAAFSGFTAPQRHEKYFVGDPTWWVADEYPPGANPYLAPGFYHPMSFQAPLPGAIYGARARVGEACSKWAGGFMHYIVGLVEWCADPVHKVGCLSKCSGSPVNVYDRSAY